MYDLSKIDLGKDEAEQDQRLKEYFLKTSSYKNALDGTKTIVIGRKGSGKSAIFTLMRDELEEQGTLVIPITPDQYSWSALRNYRETEILPIQAHANAWKLTLLASAVWKMYNSGLLDNRSKLVRDYKKYLRDAYIIDQNNWLFNIIKDILEKVKTQWVSFEFGEAPVTPLRVTEEIKSLLLNEWPPGKNLRILIDRLDDSWDASDESKNLIIGLLKSANDINAIFSGKITVSVFIRSDIYDTLFFDDKDKLRQNEETLFWDNEELKDVVCERVKVSLVLKNADNAEIWRNMFSSEIYRSKAKPEKYITLTLWRGE
jgi:hypothetical protein